MDPLSELHRREYVTTDFARQLVNQKGGLVPYEGYYVDRYLDPRARTLDVGTGGGRVAFGLEHQWHFADITAVDFVEEFVQVASERATALRSPIRFLVGNALELPLANESFAQVISYGVLLSHFPRRALRLQVLAEMRRVLKPGGVLLLNVHNISRDRSVRALRWITKAARVFGRPHRYWENDLPRVGAKGGRLDLFFLRRNKSHLHYYYPAELAFDVLAAGFVLLELNCSAKPLGELPQTFHRFGGSVSLHIAARKPA